MPKRTFQKIYIQEDARDEKNVGELNEVLSLLVHIFRVISQKQNYGNQLLAAW